ncbi:Hypothetical protein, putative [Bodo saltans]|uniref:Membrane-associated protein n=1 Tax=Bodo saltans TaxID=75058 RepID=A0A0S4IMS2_BODSA|nr:Hypothetical protein, putative [Bodo saltans]|eukprot:CUE72860.1 Hypothetical protein, putative [Bodo saltans]
MLPVAPMCCYIFLYFCFAPWCRISTPGIDSPSCPLWSQRRRSCLDLFRTISIRLHCVSEARLPRFQPVFGINFSS